MKEEKHIMQKEEWFANWFDSPYYHTLYKHRDDKEAANFIDNLIRFLKPHENASILDLACGKGRHAIYLAKMGYSVTGVDLSKASISAARKFETNNLAFFQHDMRKIFRKKYFDFIFNLFTSFGYFDSEEDHLKTLKNSRKGLKHEGKLIIDFMNAVRVIHNLVKAESKTVDGIEFQIQRKVEEGYIIKDIRFNDKGSDFHFTEKVRAFDLKDFKSLLKNAGLEIEQIFGDYDLNPFVENMSPRLILLTKKNA